MAENLIIKSAGDIFGNQVVLDTGCYLCGDIAGGIGIRLGSNACGFVLSWEDFEAAYLKLRAERDKPEFQEWVAKQTAERDAYNARKVPASGDSKEVDRG